MAESENSLGRLIDTLVQETRDLIREEIALARAELRQQMAYMQTVAVAFAGATLAAILGTTLLCVAIGGAIAYALSWPAWGGYGIVAVLLLAAGAGLAMYARSQLARVHGLPETAQSVKETVSWIQHGGKP